MIEPLDQVTFHCRRGLGGCGHQFEAAPEKILETPDDDRHPYDYEATCPRCGQVASQAAWERNLLKAHRFSTGPTSDAGKAKTRFNALKHGMRGRVATYYPARPGHYPECKTCDLFANGCSHEMAACQKKLELFFRHHIAFESKDPTQLMDMYADIHASVVSIINSIILDITQRGVTLVTPQWYYDKDGDFHLAEYSDRDTGQQMLIHEVNAHPLLRVLKDLISANSLSLADMGMTPRSQEEKDIIDGHLDDQGRDRQSMLEFEERQAQALEGLREMIERSQSNLRHDPVLIEHGEAQQDE